MNWIVMRSLFAAGFFALATLTGVAQTFVASKQLALPDSLTESAMDILDADHDGLPDVVLTAQSKSGSSYLMFIKGDTINPIALSDQWIPAHQAPSWFAHDYDNDNQVDLVMAVDDGTIKRTLHYSNTGNLNFVAATLNVSQFSFGRAADLNDDGRTDLIVSGEDAGGYFIRTISLDAGVWKVTHDSLKIKLSSFVSSDFNKDGRRDIFLSGRVTADSVVSAFLMNDGFGYQVAFSAEWMADVFPADLNRDGVFELVGSGVDDKGNLSKVIFRSVPDFVAEVIGSNLLKANVFSADLTSDGLVDESLFAISQANDTINSAVIANGINESLPHRNVVSQRFADMEHDGDLDVFQLLKASDGRLIVNVLENATVMKNKAPTKPSSAFAIPIFTKTLFFWTESSDDHTPSAAITYDLYIDGTSMWQEAFFDLANGKRLIAGHGNNGSATLRLIDNADLSNLTFSVQAVDNALHADANSICVGSGSACVNVTNEKIAACVNEVFGLDAPTDATWYSFNKGWLGKQSMLELTAQESDTLFYVIPSASGCSELKVFEIDVSNDHDKSSVIDRYVCAGTQLELEANPLWPSHTWTSTATGSLGNTSKINYEASVNDVVKVVSENGGGCVVETQYNIVISDPQLTSARTSYNLMKGQSVQLQVSGAETYSWSPAESLSNAGVANPVATPPGDVVYTVTGYDSIGCTATLTIALLVEGTGFIATLFSPNDDGRNDLLKVYGLSSADGFSLKIYNREGVVVYSAGSIAEASSGWDGTTNGAKQPNGVYFWKVKGQYSSGRRLLLNGKDEGSVVLLR